MGTCVDKGTAKKVQDYQKATDKTNKPQFKTRDVVYQPSPQLLKKPSARILDQHIQDESNQDPDHPVDLVFQKDMIKLHHKLLGVVFCKGPGNTFKTGTGILISSDLVLTCAHSIFNEIQHKPFYELYFCPGQYGQLKKFIKVTSYRHPKQYFEKKQGYKKYDYALLQLREKIAERQFIELSGTFSEKDKDSTIMVYGYPNSKYGYVDGMPRKIQQYGLTRKGFILQVMEEEGYLFHRISTEKGQSGAPVLSQNSEGKLSIIGIHVGISHHQEHVTKFHDQYPELEKVSITKLLSNGVINRLLKFAKQMEGQMFDIHSEARQIEKIYTMKLSEQDRQIRLSKEQIRLSKEEINKNKKILDQVITENKQLRQQSMRLKQQLEKRKEHLHSYSFDSGIKGVTVLAASYKRTPSKLTQQIEEYYQTGNSLFRQRKFKQAIDFYKKALELDHNHINANSNLALAYQHTGNLQAAIQFYSKVLSIDPHCDITLNNLGFALAKNRQWSEAIKCYKQAIEIDPYYAIVYDNLTKISWEQVDPYVLEDTIHFLSNRDPITANLQKALESLINYQERIDKNKEKWH